MGHAILPPLLLVVVFLFLFVLWRNARYNRVLSNGVAARGILLRVAAQPDGNFGTGLNRVQTRPVRIDVEVAGSAPYEVETSLFIPANFVRDVVPGATVELRVSPSDSSLLVVVGPGTGFLGQVLTQTAVTPAQVKGAA